MAGIPKEDIKASRILIVDDEPINLIVVSELLEMDGYHNITQISDPFEAVKAYQSTDFDLVLLDINMPGLDGFGVLEKFSDSGKHLEPPVLVLTAQMDKKVRHRALKEGARDFLLKPFDTEEILSRVHNLLEMHHAQQIVQNYNDNLEKVVKKRTQELLNTQLEIVQRLGIAAEYRDTETAEHTIRVGDYSRILGEELGLKGKVLQNLHHAAPMHDIGKIGISDAVLLKPGKFTPEERKEMESHTLIGAKILKGSVSALLSVAKEIAQNHHERWDGKGYPSGLKKEEIPLNGRIVMVADVFDALTMDRPYKKAWSIEDAVTFIGENSGSMFDPSVVAAFNERLPEIKAVKQRITDSFQSQESQNNAYKETKARAYILGVDDEPINRIIMAEMLEDDYELVCVKDGETCLELINERIPDLILLDVKLPGISGLEVCRQLRADSRNTHIPIIFVSSLATPDECSAGYEAGCDDYTTKPFVDDDLLNKIELMLALQNKNSPLKQIPDSTK